MDSTQLYVLRRPDGSFKLFADPDYAKDRGVSLDQLICVEVPNTIYATGSVDDVSTYIAKQLEQRTTS